MKRITLTLVLAFGTTLGCAQAFADPKPCEELRGEIASKLDAKGVQNYSLDIIAPDEAKGRKIVGSCEAGTKRIAYSRGDAVTAEAAADKHAEAAD